MRKALASLVAVLALPALARAGEVEICGLAGYTFPLYTQQFTYDSGPVSVALPGVAIRQEGTFELKASGGTAFGGAITLFPLDNVGFEFRVDNGELSIQTHSPSYEVVATLPAPLAPVNATLTLEDNETQVHAATPVSLNLKLRTSGTTRVFLSGGLSHMSDLGLDTRQTVALGVRAVNQVTNQLEIATISMRARRKPGDPKSNWGGNLGLGFKIPLGERGGLVVEGRGFYFPKQAFEWEPLIETPLGTVEQILLPRLQERLTPVEFKPWWVQASAGFSYRF